LATFDAIAAVSAAICELLTLEAASAGLEDVRFVLDDIAASDLPVGGGRHGAAGHVVLHLARVSPVAPGFRQPPRGPQPGEHGLGLDLHFVLVAHASDPAWRLSLLGWCIATLDAHPILTAALLNRAGLPATAPPEPIFEPHETVTIALESPTPDELAAALGSPIPPAAGYVARGVVIRQPVP
jgi:hypothetical protein